MSEAPEAASAVALVSMVRDPDEYPAPHSASVHPDEVEGFREAGWIEGEAPEPGSLSAMERPALLVEAKLGFARYLDNLDTDALRDMVGQLRVRETEAADAKAEAALHAEGDESPEPEAPAVELPAGAGDATQAAAQQPAVVEGAAGAAAAAADAGKPARKGKAAADAKPEAEADAGKPEGEQA